MSENKAAMVGWALSPTGYVVTVYDAEVQPLREESYGNHPLTNTDMLAADDEHAVRTDVLARWAEKTARDMASEWNVPEDGIFHDTDLQDALAEEHQILFVSP